MRAAPQYGSGLVGIALILAIIVVASGLLGRLG